VALDDMIDSEIGIAVAATAAVVSPRARSLVRQGAVYGGVEKLALLELEPAELGQPLAERHRVQALERRPPPAIFQWLTSGHSNGQPSGIDRVESTLEDVGRKTGRFLAAALARAREEARTSGPRPNRSKKGNAVRLGTGRATPAPWTPPEAAQIANVC
jgi:hypothetical protein